MPMRYSQDELYHYGVPGMKWGHRKSVYDINAAYYNNRARRLDRRAQKNRLMASMNKRAADVAPKLIAKANRVNVNYYTKKANKLTAKADKRRAIAERNTQASKQKKAAKAAKIKQKMESKSAKAASSSKQAVSGKAIAQRMLAKNFEINERFYKDRNPDLAIRNRDAKIEALNRAKKYQMKANARKQR